MIQDKRETAGEDAAALEWREGDLPVSLRFGDPYYSKHDGLAETRHVFIDGNRLGERFASLRPGETFTIAELGFGTGLNFLAALGMWRRMAPPSARLAFLSFELYPMTAGELSRALSHWPELGPDTQALAAAWQPEFEFMEWQAAENAGLKIFFSDANIRLPQLAFEADAWFLDGFSPARNPELWNENLMCEVFRHASPGGTFATYAAAGWVRRNLQEAGFAVERLKGFAGKRQMMAGCKL